MPAASRKFAGIWEITSPSQFLYPSPPNQLYKTMNQTRTSKGKNYEYPKFTLVEKTQKSDGTKIKSPRLGSGFHCAGSRSEIRSCFSYLMAKEMTRLDGGWRNDSSKDSSSVVLHVCLPRRRERRAGSWGVRESVTGNKWEEYSSRRLGEGEQLAEREVWCGPHVLEIVKIIKIFNPNI